MSVHDNLIIIKMKYLEWTLQLISFTIVTLKFVDHITQLCRIVNHEKVRTLLRVETLTNLI